MICAPFPEAVVICHPNLTAAAAIQVARESGRELVQTSAGNFYLSVSSAAPMRTVPPAILLAESVAGVVAGPYPEAA